ncbi:MAG TPA: Glu-tRNA(Gln) amidotransferase subunit GatD [Candidatus Acidoferrum sp.]|nr:Glu-tRNA(Gln) amidotransferase subunit GatD [Candidatus Acidoferrum sp.]
MSEKDETSGYSGEALDILKKAKVEIGDKVRVSRKERAYEGILIPRSEYGDEKHVVIKLKSGYNIGVRVTEDTKIEKTGEGSKPTFSAPPTPNQNLNLPRVTIMSTGGTIASRVDYRTGAVRPALSASDLYSVVPELAEIARIDTQILFSLFSENITPKHWTEISNAVAEQINKGVDGIVIPHGTDTMGYTAAALSFTLQDLPVPVVLVGAQRSADRPSSDAATNLIGAVTAATKAPFAEVTLAFHETPSDRAIVLHKGTKVRKCHTSRRDTFKSINASPLAKVSDQKITMLTRDYKKRDRARKLILKPEFCDRVALLKFHPGMDPTVLEWYINKGYKGIILEGTGLGHVSKYFFDPIRDAVEHNIIVAMTSQCIWGRINMNVYATGRDLLALGVIPLENMIPETALVKLMWTLGQTRDTEEAKKLLTTNIADEFSPRTLLDNPGDE